MIDSNGRVSWKLFVAALSFFVIVGSGLGTLLAKDIDKNEERIEKNRNCLENLTTSSAVIQQQIAHLKEDLAEKGEEQRKRDILIIEKLNRLLNGD